MNDSTSSIGGEPRSFQTDEAWAASVAQRKLQALSARKDQSQQLEGLKGLPIEMVHAVIDSLPVADVLSFYLSEGFLRDAVMTHLVYKKLLTEQVCTSLMLLRDIMMLSAWTNKAGEKTTTAYLSTLRLTRQNIQTTLDYGIRVQGALVMGLDGKPARELIVEKWTHGGKVDYKRGRKLVNQALASRNPETIDLVSDMMALQLKLVETYSNMVTSHSDPGDEPRRPTHILDSARYKFTGRTAATTRRSLFSIPRLLFIPYRRYERLLKGTDRRFSSSFECLTPKCVETIRTACAKKEWFGTPIDHHDAEGQCQLALDICSAIMELQALTGPMGDYARQKGKHVLQVADWRG
ncbi:hypothetical protein PUNSTDRAFT_120660 [Punctularia strigosozonata HHB-11173 SS5]|uniref:uncharacterized protein n=1 Tax=Punctularia strigosozonata (strain HHB-11173) TaxID=741275 RepID=UPI0004417615|nr:uncharacterized protein PUNSTDRAFT_120660 [Punctularia strigosozonata HHB-11173 SS5]EIN08220.1 hypothetical protein PUNSTDRAFT_120660 [Punctularia strigosozonata HHB-11173 SS5]